MSRCGRCGKVYREPEDEQGTHPCPKCGFEWWAERENEEIEGEEGGEEE